MSNIEDFRGKLRELINEHSRENGSDTPDHILADYLTGCLELFDDIVNKRDQWHGFKPWPKNAIAEKGEEEINQ